MNYFLLSDVLEQSGAARLDSVSQSHIMRVVFVRFTRESSIGAIRNACFAVCNSATIHSAFHPVRASHLEWPEHA